MRCHRENWIGVVVLLATITTSCRTAQNQKPVHADPLCYQFPKGVNPGKAMSRLVVSPDGSYLVWDGATDVLWRRGNLENAVQLEQARNNLVIGGDYLFGISPEKRDLVTTTLPWDRALDSRLISTPPKDVAFLSASPDGEIVAAMVDSHDWPWRLYVFDLCVNGCKGSRAHVFEAAQLLTNVESDRVHAVFAESNRVLLTVAVPDGAWYVVRADVDTKQVVRHAIPEGHRAFPIRSRNYLVADRGGEIANLDHDHGGGGQPRRILGPLAPVDVPVHLVERGWFGLLFAVHLEGTAGETRWVILDPESGKVSWSLSDGEVRAVNVQPDGTVLVARSRGVCAASRIPANQ